MKARRPNKVHRSKAGFPLNGRVTPRRRTPALPVAGRAGNGPPVESEAELLRSRQRLEELERTLGRLEETCDEYIELFNAAPLRYLVLDDLGFIRRYNQSLLALLHASTLTVNEELFVRFILREDIDLFLACLRDCKLKRKRVVCELRLRRLDGAIVPVELVLVPIEPQGLHSPTQFRAAIVDISERRAAEEALAQTQRGYQAVVDAIEGVVWEAEAASLELTFVSRSAERLFGYPTEHWYHPGFWERHVYVEDRDRVMNQLARAIAGSNNVALEYRVRAADRGLVWVHDRIVIRELQRRLKLSGVGVDITARKAVKEGLECSQ